MLLWTMVIHIHALSQERYFTFFNLYYAMLECNYWLLLFGVVFY